MYWINQVVKNETDAIFSINLVGKHIRLTMLLRFPSRLFDRYWGNGCSSFLAWVVLEVQPQDSVFQPRGGTATVWLSDAWKGPKLARSASWHLKPVKPRHVHR